MAFLHENEFWILIAFLVAVGVLLRQAWGQITGSLDTRAQAIRLQIDEAKRLREEAEAMLAQYQLKQRDAIAEAQEIIVHAQEEAQRVARQAEAELEAAIKRREEQARDKIAQAEVKALAEIRTVAVDVAIRAVRILLAETIDPARGSALIDQAIDELPKRLH
ncbi:MAG: F-type H+-transporting ATPase subunit b [Bradyrhizobium sp.]|jgi:F-type H+-transporting ATPase subunit b|nr:F-type H+-transporting ATPase subunit b [Bradyrhizobium sp.]